MHQSHEMPDVNAADSMNSNISAHESNHSSMTHTREKHIAAAPSDVKAKLNVQIKIEETSQNLVLKCKQAIVLYISISTRHCHANYDLCIGSISCLPVLFSTNTHLSSSVYFFNPVSSSQVSLIDRLISLADRTQSLTPTPPCQPGPPTLSRPLNSLASSSWIRAI